MAESGSKTTIVVALISLVGVLGGAVIANWDKLTAKATSRPQAHPQETPPIPVPKDDPPQPPVARSPEDVLVGHWMSTFENPLFSVINISREGSEVHVQAYVNNRGADGGGCVYNAILDGKRGVFAKGKTVEWQLPTLPLPCANWVPQGFTGASLSVAIADDSPNTLATVVNMYAGQQILAGSGPFEYVRK